MSLEQKIKYYRLEPEDFIPLYGMSRHKKRVLNNLKKRKNEGICNPHKELIKAGLYGSVLTVYNIFIGVVIYHTIMNILE